MAGIDQTPKIVHVTSVHRWGDVRIFQKQCRSLAANGYDVVLVAVAPQDMTHDGVRLRALPTPRSVWHRMLVTACQAMRVAWRERADLYQIHDAELLPWAFVMRCAGRTVIYDMHENLPKDLLDKTWLPRWLRPLLATCARLVERVLLFRMPVIFAEESYAREYPWVRDAQIILNLPRTEILPSPSAKRDDPPMVGYIGGVAVDRGSAVTVKALARLKDRGLAVGWHCVGPTWPRHLADDLARESDEAGIHIVLHGYLPHDEGWAVMNRCVVGLAVLEPRPNFVESLPTKLFEYMALELPVIASDFPLYRRIVDDAECGICVDPYDAEALADAIQSLVANPERAQQMGRRGREAVFTRYNWATELGKLIAFYEQRLPAGRNLDSASRTNGNRDGH